MTKLKTAFFCQNCGAQAPKWMGKCNACGEWNTFIEEVIQREETGSLGLLTRDPRSVTPVRISEVTFSHEARINTHDQELNRVLGGGLVPGSLTLIGGEQG